MHFNTAIIKNVQQHTIYSTSLREGTKQVLPTQQRAPASPIQLGGEGLA